MTEQRGPIAVDVGDFHVLVDTELPALFNQYVAHAELADVQHVKASEGAPLFVAVQEGSPWPRLVAALRYSPAGHGFAPGVVLVPETRTLFVGAGTRLVAYTLGANIERLWEDQAEMGFWRWQLVRDRVIMSAELELAAWDTSGRKLWTTFVEPPWTYDVEGDSVRLDVMGTVSTFPLDTGPTWNKLPWA
jgi:hypothetical protein